MASKSSRVSLETHARIRRLAAERHTTLGKVVTGAVNQLERTSMLDAYNAAVARLRANPVAAADYDAEMAAWESTLADGLDEYPYEGIEELMEAEYKQ